jgi:HEAT repeat protein
MLMSGCRNRRWPRAGRQAAYAAILAVCALASVVGVLAAQQPVEEIRRILKETSSDAAARDRQLQEQAGRLVGVADLARVLALEDWRFGDAEDQIAAVDRVNRQRIIDRFEQGVRQVLRRGDPASRLAVLSLLTKLGPEVRDEGQTSLTSAFSSDLAYLLRERDAETRRAAARTLGALNPRPEVAGPELGRLLSAADRADRLAAAAALTALVQTSARLASRTAATGATAITRSEHLQTARTVVPLAGHGLADHDSRVRRQSLLILTEAAAIAHECLEASGRPVDQSRDLSAQTTDTEDPELLSLLAALRIQGPALTLAMGDPDPETRLLARRVLENMLGPQIVLAERQLRIASPSRQAAPVALQPAYLVGPAAGRDPVLQGLNQTVQALAAAVNDNDVRARRAALDALETLGPVAAASAKALVGALGDNDPFVRWSAARTLGKISPVAADLAVPALARLITDPDLDVRLAAAGALEQYGPAARSAVPQLIYAVRSSDAELRIASIRALGAAGGREAQKAVPELRQALTDSDPRVRQAAALVLGRLGPSAAAAPALKSALRDPDPEVQRAASEALLNILSGTRK